jgi:hypothetical protein
MGWRWVHCQSRESEHQGTGAGTDHRFRRSRFASLRAQLAVLVVSGGEERPVVSKDCDVSLAQANLFHPMAAHAFDPHGFEHCNLLCLVALLQGNTSPPL